MHTCIHTCIHTNTYKQRLRRAHTYISTYISTYIHTHTHMHACMQRYYINTYTQVVSVDAPYLFRVETAEKITVKNSDVTKKEADSLHQKAVHSGVAVTAGLGASAMIVSKNLTAGKLHVLWKQKSSTASAPQNGQPFRVDRPSQSREPFGVVEPKKKDGQEPTWDGTSLLVREGTEKAVRQTQHTRFQPTGSRVMSSEASRPKREGYTPQNRTAHEPDGVPKESLDQPARNELTLDASITQLRDGMESVMKLANAAAETAMPIFQQAATEAQQAAAEQLTAAQESRMLERGVSALKDGADQLMMSFSFPSEDTNFLGLGNSSSATLAGSRRGKPKANQDKVLISALPTSRVDLYGVIDGHGPNGGRIAAWLQRMMPDALDMALGTCDDVDVMKKVIEAFGTPDLPRTI